MEKIHVALAVAILCSALTAVGSVAGHLAYIIEYYRLDIRNQMFRFRMGLWEYCYTSAGSQISNSSVCNSTTKLNGYYYGADNSALRDQNLTAAAMLILGTVSACGTIVTIGVSHMRLNSYRSRASYIALSSLSATCVFLAAIIISICYSPTFHSIKNHEYDPSFSPNLDRFIYGIANSSIEDQRK
ncbi:uncharacterized protein LOC142340098 isoform X2 [Convolutriloba macropyga]|uniref:uncharacterized protein LOC142340098 isoform X2 n=1 Tax=Convolutriloba macropyga TaxID=536237 RepID=UPI003F526E38